MRIPLACCLPWAAARERLVSSTSGATLEDAGWQRLRGHRATMLKEQKSAAESTFAETRLHTQPPPLPAA